MAVIGSVDPVAKRIYLGVGVREYHPVLDLYREMRELRRTDESLRPYDVPLVASGNVPKGGGKFTPRLVTFRQGWKVVPEDTSHVLSVTGEQITDQGEAGPAAFDLSSLDPGSKVIIQYEPPAAEIIEVGVSGDGVRVSQLDPGVIDDIALDDTAVRAIADALLERNIAGGADGGRDVRSALQILRNRKKIVGGLLTVYQEDDGTTAWTASVATAPGNPITEIDPV